MGSNHLEDTGKKSVRINETDQEKVEAAGYDLGTSASTLFHKLAEDAALLEKIKEEKREEVRKLREDARDLESKFDL